MIKQNPVNVSNVILKQYSYTKDGVSLNFSLSLENDRQLSAFLECLEKAKLDIQEDISKMSV